MIQAIIVEDEPRSMAVLQSLLTEYCHEINVVATANTALKAIKVIQENEADLIFLDINLGQANAFEILDVVDTNKAKIIFTTGDESYAVKAFQYNAIDYLLKPVDPDFLVKAVKKVTSKQRDTTEQYKNAITEAQKISRISLPSIHGYELVDVDDIVYCEAQGSSCNIITVNGDKKTVSKSLGYFEETLSENGFYRIHKKHIINLKKLAGFTRDKAPEVTLSNGEKLIVSSRSRADFFEKLKDYAII